MALLAAARLLKSEQTPGACWNGEIFQLAVEGFLHAEDPWSVEGYLLAEGP